MNGILRDAFDALLDAFEVKKAFNAEYARETVAASRWNKGFPVSKHRKLKRRQSFANMLLVGPTSSGKTTRVLLKVLWNLKRCSMVINDPSGELYALTSGYLSQFFTIRTLNFSDSSQSSGYNILSRIKKHNDISKIVHVLVSATLDKGGSSDPFWSLSTKNLLTIITELVLHQPEEFRTIANVIQCLHYFATEPRKVDAWITASHNEKLILSYKSLLSTPEKTLANIVASAKSALQLFDGDPEILRTTSFDSIDFDELRHEPTCIFLRNSIADQKYVSVLNSIFFEQLYGHVLQRLPDKNELDLFFIMEEASSMYIPLLPLALANCRKHRAGTLVCVQSVQQLRAFYKDDADNIATNCVTKLFMPGQTSMDTLREIEALSGKCIYKDEKGTERVKPLITTDEIRLLPESRTLILCGNKPLSKAVRRPITSHGNINDTLPFRR